MTLDPAERPPALLAVRVVGGRARVFVNERPRGRLGAVFRWAEYR